MIEEYFLIIGSGLSGVSVSEYLLKKDLPFDIADTREVPPFEINPSKNGKAFFGDDSVAYTHLTLPTTPYV